MIPLLLLLQAQSPLAARADTIHPVHDALHYDITLVPGDTGTHVLAEVQTTWRLRSSEPVEMELDSALRVVRVLVDGKANTRLSRTLYARSEGAVEVPHEKQAGDTITTRVRYHGQVRDGLVVGKNQYGAPSSPTTGLTAPISGSPLRTIPATRQPSPSTCRHRSAIG
jgi:hypothetical protein